MIAGNELQVVSKPSDASRRHLYASILNRRNRVLKLVLGIGRSHTVSDGLPTVELLESTHNFPCRYLFKVIGRDEDDFTVRVVTAVRTALEASVDPPHRLRHTSGGAHVSVSLEPVLKSADQVLAVYRLLHQTDGVVMIL